MAIKIGGTEVINNSRELQNISGIDAGSITNLVSAGLGTPTPFVTETGTFTTNQFNFDTGNYFEKTLTSNATFTFNESLTSGNAYEAKVKLAVAADAQNSDLFADLSTDGIAAMGVTGGTTTDNGGIYGSTNSNAGGGIDFNSDGTRIVVTSSTSDKVMTYSLITAYDISTASVFPIHIYDLNAAGWGGTTPRSGKFVDSGTKFIVSCTTNDKLYQFDLTTAYDLATATFTVATGTLGSVTSPYGFYMKPDGTELWVADGYSANRRIYSYSLSTAFDLSTLNTTASSNYNYGVAVTENALGFTMNADGTKFYITGVLTDQIQQFSMSTAYDITTASYDGASTALNVGNPQGIVFNSDGSELIVCGNGSPIQFGSIELSTAYDVTGASDSLGVSEFTNTGLGQGAEDQRPLILANNDAKMYFIGQNGTYNYVFQYDITGNKQSTKQYKGKIDLASLTSNANVRTYGIGIKSDGTKLYSLDYQDSLIYQFSLSTAWDITTATYDSVTFDFSSQGSSGRALQFKSDGTAMYLNSGSTIYQYTLSTAWDISTASYASKSLSTSSQESGLVCFTFTNDGSKLLASGTSSNNIHEYALSTAWDISTGTFSNTLDFTDTTWEADYGIDASGDVFGLALTSDDSKLLLFKQDNAIHGGDTILHTFDFGASDPAITWPSSVTWYGGSAPSIARGDTALLSLSTNDGGTSWYGNRESPAPAATQTYSYISGATADNSATVEFTLPTGYDGFEFRFYNVTGDFDGAEIWVKVGTSNTIYTYYARKAGTGYDGNSSGSTNGAELALNVGTVSGDAGLSGIVYVDGNYADSASQTTGRYFTTHEDSTTADLFIRTNGMFATASAAAETSIVFKSTSGSGLLETGTFTMYGIKSS